MPETDLNHPPIADLARDLRAGAITSVSLTETLLDRIALLDPGLNAFIAVCADRARQDARRADRELGSGLDRGPLHGIPYALKDIFDVAGLPTTCCSRLSPDRPAAVDSAVQAILSSAGAVLLGKTTTHEFALGGPSFDLPRPPARNPFDRDHFSGGSSSGSAVAVAAGFAPFAMGSDTSGSIRGPACYCGLVGLKPTYAVVPCKGAFPLSWSLDHCGPMTWTIDDARLVFEALTSGNARYRARAARADRKGKGLDRDPTRLRVGYAREFFASDCSAEVLGQIDETVDALAALGTAVREVELPPFELFNAAGRIIMTAEGYAIHEEALRERPLDFGRYTYQRLIPGGALSAVNYVQAQRQRRELTRLLNLGPLKDCDVLVCGVAMTTAPPLDSFGDDWEPRTTMRSIPFTVTGNPAIAVPIGAGRNGLPAGLQLVARHYEERLLFEAAALVERIRSGHRPNPRIGAGCEGPGASITASG